MSLSDNPKTTLILGKPGPLRDSILAFLSTMPQMKTFLLAVDEVSALRLIQETEIDLFIFDMNNSLDSVVQILIKIKLAKISTPSLVLADNPPDKIAAEHAGASACILKGFAVQQLDTSIQQIFQRHVPKENDESEE